MGKRKFERMAVLGGESTARAGSGTPALWHDADHLYPLRRTVSDGDLAYLIRTLLRFSAQTRPRVHFADFIRRQPVAEKPGSWVETRGRTGPSWHAPLGRRAPVIRSSRASSGGSPPPRLAAAQGGGASSVRLHAPSSHSTLLAAGTRLARRFSKPSCRRTTVPLSLYR
jgi:hypothetical protein